MSCTLNLKDIEKNRVYPCSAKIDGIPFNNLLNESSNREL